MGRAADALGRPALPAAPRTATPAPARPVKRVTLDLDVEVYRRLRSWVLDADLDASTLLRALLGLAEGDPVVRSRAEAAATVLVASRRADR